MANTLFGSALSLLLFVVYALRRAYAGPAFICYAGGILPYSFFKNWTLR